jgi:hypothetical protein
VAIRAVFERMTVADLAERHRRRVQIFAPSELIRPRS